jgi:hypothetical protein
MKIFLAIIFLILPNAACDLYYLETPDAHAEINDLYGWEESKGPPVRDDLLGWTTLPDLSTSSHNLAYKITREIKSGNCGFWGSEASQMYIGNAISQDARNCTSTFKLEILDSNQKNPILLSGNSILIFNIEYLAHKFTSPHGKLFYDLIRFQASVSDSEHYFVELIPGFDQDNSPRHDAIIIKLPDLINKKYSAIRIEIENHTDNNIGFPQFPQNIKDHPAGLTIQTISQIDPT